MGLGAIATVQAATTTAPVKHKHVTKKQEMSLSSVSTAVMNGNTGSGVAGASNSVPAIVSVIVPELRGHVGATSGGVPFYTGSIATTYGQTVNIVSTTAVAINISLTATSTNFTGLSGGNLLFADPTGTGGGGAISVSPGGGVTIAGDHSNQFSISVQDYINLLVNEGKLDNTLIAALINQGVSSATILDDLAVAGISTDDLVRSLATVCSATFCSTDEVTNILDLVTGAASFINYNHINVSPYSLFVITDSSGVSGVVSLNDYVAVLVAAGLFDSNAITKLISLGVPPADIIKAMQAAGVTSANIVSALQAAGAPLPYIVSLLQQNKVTPANIGAALQGANPSITPAQIVSAIQSAESTNGGTVSYADVGAALGGAGVSQSTIVSTLQTAKVDPANIGAALKGANPNISPVDIVTAIQLATPIGQTVSRVGIGGDIAYGAVNYASIGAALSGAGVTSTTDLQAVVTALQNQNVPAAKIITVLSNTDAPPSVVEKLILSDLGGYTRNP